MSDYNPHKHFSTDDFLHGIAACEQHAKELQRLADVDHDDAELPKMIASLRRSAAFLMLAVHELNGTAGIAHLLATSPDHTENDNRA